MHRMPYLPERLCPMHQRAYEQHRYCALHDPHRTRSMCGHVRPTTSNMGVSGTLHLINGRYYVQENSMHMQRNDVGFQGASYLGDTSPRYTVSIPSRNEHYHYGNVEMASELMSQPNESGDLDEYLYHPRWSFLRLRRQLQLSALYSSLMMNSVARGATPASIESNTLSFEYKKEKNKGNGGDADESCTVCLCPFEEGENVRKLPCEHLFHIDCIDQWLTREGRCPVCRNHIED